MSANTFTELWRNSVADNPHGTFLAFKERDEQQAIRSWTYAEFDHLVARTAHRLRSFGIQKGDAVHICLENCPAFLMVWLAIARLGAWMVPVDPTSSSRDIENQIRRTSPKVGVCATSRSEAYKTGAGARLKRIIEVSETSDDTLAGSSLMDDAEIGYGEVLPGDRIAIMFTSGTTSEPKGVILTQANYHYIGVTMAALASQKREDRWYVCLPLFHGNAQYYCFAAAIAVGASVGLTARFTASGWSFEVKELDATHASLFAAPIRMILARRRKDAPQLHLKHVWFAQSLAASQFAEFGEMCGVTPRQIYGMTETTAIVTADLSASPSNDTIGAVVPGRSLKLLDKTTLVPVADGEPGVMTLAGVRGVDLFSGYLDNDTATNRAFPPIEKDKSWFFTGDLARRRPDGRLVFVGRVDDVIKVSGENVSLTEVEAAIAEAPGVLEAAVVAIDDAVRDKVPVAYVVARSRDAPPTAEQLERWAVNHLPRAARPRKWTIVDSLPRTSVGKIRRFMLKKAS